MLCVVYTHTTDVSRKRESESQKRKTYAPVNAEARRLCVIKFEPRPFSKILIIVIGRARD